MGMLQPDGHLTNDVAGDADGNRTDPRHDPIQLIPVHEFHHHEIDFTDATCIYGSHDVRAVQQRRRANLAVKSADLRLIPRELARHDFNGDNCSGAVVSCLKHMSHTALADRSQQTILFEHETRLALKQLAGLPLRQQTQRNQFGGHTLDDSGAGITGAGRISLAILVQIFCGILRSFPLRGCQ